MAFCFFIRKLALLPLHDASIMGGIHSLSLLYSLQHVGGFVTVLSVRPKVAELAFQLYGRSLHPELFQVHKSQSIERGGYAAKVDITSAGHVVTWRYGGLTLTEVAASAQNPLPQKRRLLSYRLRGQRHDRVECRGGVTYQTSFQLEPVAPEVFWTFQQELADDGQRRGICCTCSTPVAG